MPDVLVVIPGILGSVLRRNGREVWGLSAAAGMHALGSLGGSVRDLALSGEDSDPTGFSDGVEPGHILRDLHLFPYLWKIDGYTGLTTMLTEAFTVAPGSNYFEFAYDWRRDNRLAAKRLARESDAWLRRWRETSGNAHAKLIIVAHSMGGLVARYFLEVLEGWRDTKALVTFGTPYRGSVNALRVLIEGVRKGPLGLLDLSALVRSFTSVYQLLPVYPCLSTSEGTLLHLPDAPALPNVSHARIGNAAAFHAEIKQAVDDHLKDETYRRERYRVIPVVGTHQETLQSARLLGGAGVEFLRHHAGRDLKGDGTVPRISATPIELSRGLSEVYAGTCHASLQNAEAVLYHVREAIASLDLDLSDYQYRAGPSAAVTLSLDVEDAYWDDEPIALSLLTEPQPSPALQGSITDVKTGVEIVRVSFPSGRTGWSTAELAPLPVGVYRCKLEGHFGVHPVTDIFTVFDRRQRS